MNYLIYANQEDTIAFASILAKEIFRFDIRAVVNTAGSYEALERGLFEPDFESESDVLISIGFPLKSSLFRKAKAFGVKTLLIAASHSVQSSRNRRYDLTFSYLPIPDGVRYEGNYHVDLVKQQQFEGEQSGLTIGFIFDASFNQFRSFKRLLRQIHERFPKASILVSDKQIASRLESKSFGGMKPTFRSTYEILQFANAVIVVGEDSSLKAALMNCPQIYVAHERGFFRAKQAPLISQLLGRKVLKSFSIRKANEIALELDLILSNHEYSASMLSDYQEVFIKLGGLPAARNMAQKIIDWIEE